MSGRHIAVIGGAGGIGRALVADLMAAGDAVTVLDLPASLDRHQPPCRALPLDVRSEASVAEAAAAAGTGFDGLVNLAGYNAALMPLSAMPPDYFDDVLAGNLRGVFLSTRAFLPLLGGPAPSVVLIASGLAQFVRPGYGAYAAAKAGVIALAKTFAHEAAPRVRVNVVAPGLVDTAFVRGGTGRSDEAGPPVVDFDAYARMLPLKRLALPADVTGPIRFLLGPDSAYMTGQVLWVNGGGYMP